MKTEHTVIDNTRITDEVIGKVYRKAQEIIKRLSAEKLDLKETLMAMQAIIEGKSSIMLEDLDKKVLPEEIIIGGCTYEIINPLFEKSEKPIPNNVMSETGRGLNASLGEDDGEHILQHQNDIPVILQGKVFFVFPDWRSEVNSNAWHIYWSYRDYKWVQCGHWETGVHDPKGRIRFLRRK
jgi:hypothetical protein